MSISSSTRKAGPYSCNSSTVAFPFAFKVFTTADVRVVLTDTNSVESDLALGTNYTVALNADQDANPGGTVTTTATYATGYKVTLTSQVQALQPVTLTNQGGFYPKIINDALDRLTIMAQQLAEQVSRAVKTNISSSSTPDQLLSDLNTSVSNAAAAASSASGSAAASAGYATNSANSATAAAASAAALPNVSGGANTVPVVNPAGNGWVFKTAAQLSAWLVNVVTFDTATGAASMPVGTTAQRPATPGSGMFRMNSTTGEPEWYDTANSRWNTFADHTSEYKISYLSVAGGAGGHSDDTGNAGGGGAGGLLSGSLSVSAGAAFTITIGAGGSVGANGGNTSAFSQTAIGGGTGGYYSSIPGSSGGSGGGGGQGPSAGGSGTAGQGNAGGASTGIGGGGGGGAGAVGGASYGSGGKEGGAGGVGVQSSISGTATYYAGGGGGSAHNTATNGTPQGGNGGGGNGHYGGAAATAGTANTGGGGGGGGEGKAAGAGGSGVVIVSYPGPQRATGGTVTSSGGNTIHTFTSSGTFTA